MYLNGRKLVFVGYETTKGQDLMRRYKHHLGEDLYDVYTTPSREKQNIYFDCKVYCNKVNGTDFHIAGKSGFVFTVAFKNDIGYHILTRDTHYIVICGKYTKEDLQNFVDKLKEPYFTTD